MKILYVAAKYDYGQPERGYSFEHHNFYESLAGDRHELVYFDFLTLYQELGRAEMNRRLYEVARSEQADLMFTCLFKDELDPEVVRRVSRDTRTTTLNWFCDDHWRFESFSSRWAPYFDWVVTTASSALPKYERIGYRTVIKSQWACNPHVYRKLDLPLIHDVSFVGQPHGNRRSVIQALRADGIDVYTRGYGWEEGRASQNEMIRIFNQSRINLNLPNASNGAGTVSPRRRVREAIVSRAGALPLGSKTIRTARIVARAVRRSPGAVGGGPDVLPEQIKGRNFEIPGCGGFLLTGQADNLDAYYEPGREIAVFHDFDDLVAKIRYHLRHDEERQAIAAAGRARTLREHTYTHRFSRLFETMLAQQSRA